MAIVSAGAAGRVRRCGVRGRRGPGGARPAGAVSRVKVQPANASRATSPRTTSRIDLAGSHGHLPGRASGTVPWHVRDTYAEFGRAVPPVPLAARCTRSPDGRTIEIGPHEALLAAGRAASRDPAWLADYRATRPKVERKLAHLMRRRHGGRRARVRGRLKVGADFALLAAAVNLARLAVLGLTGSGGTWGRSGPR